MSSHSTPGFTEVQSHLANDIETTRGLLSELGTFHDTSLGALTSLSEACASVWHNAIELENTGKGFFLFEDQAESWMNSESPVDRVDPYKSAHTLSVAATVVVAYMPDKHWHIFIEDTNSSSKSSQWQML